MSLFTRLTSLIRDWRQHVALSAATRSLPQRPSLSVLAQQPSRLPAWVRDCAVAMRYLHLFAPLNWEHLPERPDQRFWPDAPPLSYAPFLAAYLVKLDQQLPYMSDLRQYLVEHPALVWLLGFPLLPSSSHPWGFDVQASLPTHRHFSRMLRLQPNNTAQALIDQTVSLLAAALAGYTAAFGDAISLDTKHIIAWVKENNPKAYVSDRYDKTKQPAGDPDCRLGCKRRHNQSTGKRASVQQPPPTPTKNGVPANTISVGEYYWGYASGVVATKVPDWGEFVLAEMTQPFDRPDVSYFQPLLKATTRRLGRPPRYGAFDAAFDAFYVYEYFGQAGGFAAVPFSERGGKPDRTFSTEGLPLCPAGLAMPLRYTFQCRTALVPHQRGRYVCPLLFPQPNGQTCPIQDKHWAKKGCATTLATSIGARLRYQIDRQSESYQKVYKQRTATERINSQAKDLGIERPHIRNGAAIANHNTLIYVLINLHALQRIEQRKAQLAAQRGLPSPVTQQPAPGERAP